VADYSGMAETMSLPLASLTLLVQGRKVVCSGPVIQASSFLTDLMTLAHDAEEESEALPLPAFVSAQMMLDVVDLVATGDTEECASLVLASLSYLLDFVIVVDFLGFTKIQAAVEERIRERITDESWRIVLDYSKDKIGLFNVMKHAIHFMCETISNIYKGEVDMKTREWKLIDPFRDDYINFPEIMFKVMMRHSALSPSLKLCLLKEWMTLNYEQKEAALQLVLALPFIDFMEGEITGEVKGWELGEKAMQEVKAHEDQAKEERDKKAEEERLKREELFKERHSRMMAGRPFMVIFIQRLEMEEEAEMEEDVS